MFFPAIRLCNRIVKENTAKTKVSYLPYLRCWWMLHVTYKGGVVYEHVTFQVTPELEEETGGVCQVVSLRPPDYPGE